MAVVLPDPASLPRGQLERRQRIVKAAITLLETGEYDAIQMRDVAERGEVALATIYRYFTSKEHLYAAAMLEWASGYPTAGRAGAVSGGTDESRLRALMRRAVRAFERYPQMMRAEIVLESSNDPNARALWDEFAAQNTATLTAAMSSTDPKTAAAIVDVANAVMVTRLRSWALGRCTIRDVDTSVQRALDLLFGATPPS
jgi:TetR/AcrR family transcriptional regulator, cholesterol catabolism regulator